MRLARHDIGEGDGRQGGLAAGIHHGRRGPAVAVLGVRAKLLLLLAEQGLLLLLEEELLLLLELELLKLDLVLRGLLPWWLLEGRSGCSRRAGGL